MSVIYDLNPQCYTDLMYYIHDTLNQRFMKNPCLSELFIICTDSKVFDDKWVAASTEYETSNYYITEFYQKNVDIYLSIQNIIHNQILHNISKSEFSNPVVSGDTAEKIFRNIDYYFAKAKSICKDIVCENSNETRLHTKYTRFLINFVKPLLLNLFIYVQDINIFKAYIIRTDTSNLVNYAGLNMFTRTFSPFNVTPVERFKAGSAYTFMLGIFLTVPGSKISIDKDTMDIWRIYTSKHMKYKDLKFLTSSIDYANRFGKRCIQIRKVDRHGTHNVLRFMSPQMHLYDDINEHGYSTSIQKGYSGFRIYQNAKQIY